MVGHHTKLSAVQLAGPDEFVTFAHKCVWPQGNHLNHGAGLRGLTPARGRVFTRHRIYFPRGTEGFLQLKQETDGNGNQQWL